MQIPSELLEELEKSIGIRFKNRDLLNRALTCESYTRKYNDHGGHNEALEFLGDAVLDLVTADFLFSNYQNSDFSAQRKLISNKLLADAGRYLKLEKYIRYDEVLGIREKMIADTMEALIGAIYSEQGISAAYNFILNFFLVWISNPVIDNRLLERTKVQLSSQSDDSRILLNKECRLIGCNNPNYFLVKRPKFEPEVTFRVAVHILRRFRAIGAGATLEEAQRCAAQEALLGFDKIRKLKDKWREQRMPIKRMPEAKPVQ